MYPPPTNTKNLDSINQCWFSVLGSFEFLKNHRFPFWNFLTIKELSKVLVLSKPQQKINGFHERTAQEKTVL
jgi:hypothetical protein